MQKPVRARITTSNSLKLEEATQLLVLVSHCKPLKRGYAQDGNGGRVGS